MVLSNDLLMQKVLTTIQLAFENGDPNHYMYGRFNTVAMFLTQLKKRNELQLSNRQIRVLLSHLISIGYLDQDESGILSLTEKFESSLSEF